MSLLGAYDGSVRANSKLDAAGVDAAIIATGRAVAEQIDAVLTDPDATPYERTKALYLVPHLMNVLKEQEATPASRTAAAKVAATMKVEVEAQRDMLDELDEVTERRERRRKRA